MPVTLSTRISRSIGKRIESHIFAHLINNKTCKAPSTENSFEIINSASSSFKAKGKRGYTHNWEEIIA